MWAGGCMVSPGSPRQQAPRKRRAGTAVREWCTGSPAMGTAAAVLARMKPGDAAAAHGGQGNGSMAGVFPCLVARLPLAVSPAVSFVHAPVNGASMAHWMHAGHLCPWLCQCRSRWGGIHPGIQVDEH